ncbi:hypothetical protein ACOI1C_20515 [Bacillus sp. DJP31]|uniref:hypothetical protein n=1 Tax=Bacillus sp. DJP31 TaxID=3409789 RepID=UPI003BB4D069
MIAPFTVILIEDNQNRKPLLNRSDYYLIEQLNKHYKNQLVKLKYWPEWELCIKKLADLATEAFGGQLNLHEHNEEIKQFEHVYQLLKRKWKNN